MIPAIDPGFGIKEDQPKPQVSPTGNKDFSRALRKASRPEGGTSSKPLNEARRPGEPRDRSLYGEAQDSQPEQAGRSERDQAGDSAPKAESTRPERASPEQKEASSGEGVENAAASTPSPHLTPGIADETIVAEQASAPELTELALTSLPESAEEGLDNTGVHQLNPGMAQFGLAAWKQNPHGKGEAQAAAGNGLVFPGSAEAELLQAAQGQGDTDLSFEQSEALKLAAAGAKPLVDPEAAVDVRVRSELAEAQGLPKVEDQVRFEAAQGRAQLMQQLAAMESAASEQGKAGTSEAALQRNLFLQNQLQRTGLLMKSSRPAAPDAPAGAAQAGLGQVASFSSPKPGQIFEMPTDGAVEQRALERVASEARWLISNNRQEVRFRLNPEHLGSLHMKIVREDGAVRVDMTVDNHAAKHLLESNMDSLRQQLAGDDQTGTFMFNVDVRQGNDQSSLESRFATAPVPGRLAPGSLEAEADTGTRSRVLGHSGLSIYA